MTNTLRRARAARARDAETRPPVSALYPVGSDDLLQGWPLVGEPDNDFAAWCVEILRFETAAPLPVAVRSAATDGADSPNIATAVALSDALDVASTARDRHLLDMRRLADLAVRARISAALLGDAHSCLVVALEASSRALSTAEDHVVVRYATANQLFMNLAARAHAGAAPPTAQRLGEARDDAFGEILNISEVVELFRPGQGHGALRDDTGWVPEDDDDEPSTEQFERVVVMMRHEWRGRKEASREITEAAKGIAGHPLRLAPVPTDWAAWAAEVDREFPHAAGITRRIAAGQRGRRTWGGPRLLLRGAPGAGKTRYLRRVAEISGLAFARYACDQSTDSSFAGTPARWSTSEPSFPLRTMRQTQFANPVVCLDEIEKAGGARGSNGGKLHDCLVSMLEPESARTYWDPMFDTETDLSHVVWWMTCNESASIPGPLLDRLRVVEFPLPGAEHLAALAPRIAREIVRDQGLDEAFAVLDAADMDALAEYWRGGSLRKLSRLVETILAGREAFAPRH